MPLQPFLFNITQVEDIMPFYLIALSIYFLIAFPQNQTFKLVGKAQGTTYAITYHHPSQAIHQHQIDSLFKLLDDHFSLYQSESVIKRFNQSPTGILADKHTATLINHSIEIAHLTNGSFDITLLPLSLLWGKFSRQAIPVPSDSMINVTLANTGYHQIYLMSDSLLKRNPCIQIDPDGIAQGYAVDVIAQFLDDHFIADYLVEIGGEIMAKGVKPNGSHWNIQYPSASDYVDNPFKKLPVITLSNLAVSTSASMSKSTILESGLKKSHILDPKTGMTIENGIISVTVIAPKAVLADGLDNAFLVMGVENALGLANTLTDIGVNIVYVNKYGKIRDTCNAFFSKFIKE